MSYLCWFYIFVMDSFGDLNLLLWCGLGESCCPTDKQNTSNVGYKEEKMYSKTLTNNIITYIIRNIEHRLDPLVALHHQSSQSNLPGKNATGQYLCEPDLEIEVNL